MATASMPAALSLGTSAFTAPSSSGIRMLPRPSMRSGTPKRRSRGTSGGGFIMKMSYCSKRCSKAISIESKALGDDQRRLGALALDDGIGRQRRAVDDEAEIG